MESKFKGIKTAAEYKRGELAKDILKLVAAGVSIGTAAAMAPNTMQLIEYFEPKGRDERNKIWKMIKYLETRQDIAFQEYNGNDYVVLTQQGRVRLNEDAIWELAIVRPTNWDRKWRIVMFDFPQRYNTARRAFRTKLEDFGFEMYQESVFIYPFECNEEIQTVAKWFGVDEYVRYVVATEIHDMRRFAKLFDLL